MIKFLPSIPYIAFTILVAGAFQSAQGADLRKGPLARIVPFHEAPRIDGCAAEAGWQRSVTISDFILMGSHRPVVDGATEVRIAYDRDSLYLHARCEEPLLVTDSQRQSEMKVAAKKGSDEVLHDENLFLLLKAPDRNTVYEIAVNPKGIVSGAKSPAGSLWGGRESGWNPKLEVAAREDEGFWEVELAIPWGELQAEPPREGEKWEVSIARHARGRGEVSSWNASGAGAHAPEEYGTLVFGGEGYGLRSMRRMTTLETDANELLVATADSETGRKLVIATEVKGLHSPENPSRERTSLPAGERAEEGGKGAHRFKTSTSDGIAIYSWEVYEASTLSPVYRSARQNVPVQTASAEIVFSAKGPYQLWVNDEMIDSGKEASGASVKLPLRSGLNQIAFRSETGEAQLDLKSEALADLPIRWKTAAAEVKGAMLSTLDDSGWKTASPQETEGTLGSHGQAAVFRHALLVRKTRVWPLPQPSIGVARGSTQHVMLTAEGLPGRPLNDWQIRMQVSPELEVVGATGFGGNREDSQLNPPNKVKFALKSLGQNDLGKQQYRIVSDNPLLHVEGGHTILRSLEVMLRVKEGVAEPSGKIQKFTYVSSANDGTVSELGQEVAVEILPELRGQQPKKMVWQLWGAWLTIMDDEAMLAALCETARKAGFNEVTGSAGIAPRLSEQLEKHSLGYLRLLTFRPWGVDMAGYLKETPSMRMLDHEGTLRDDLVCTSALLDEAKPVLRERVGDFVKMEKATTIIYDFEQRALRGHHSCYCPRCLESFRLAAGLPAGSELTPAGIGQSYHPEWSDFMARRVAQLLLVIKESIHQAAPETRFGVYSGYQTPENPSRYGIDWRYLGELKAIDFASCGYGRSQEVIDATLKALNGIPTVFGELLTPYLTESLNFDRPATQVTAANLLRRSLDATGGVLVYDRKSMDGHSWNSVATVTRLVSAYEPLFLERQLKAVEGQDPAGVELLIGKDEALLCLMNLETQAKRFSVPLPKEYSSARRFESDEGVQAGEVLEVELKKGEIAVYVLKR